MRFWTGLLLLIGLLGAGPLLFSETKPGVGNWPTATTSLASVWSQANAEVASKQRTPQEDGIERTRRGLLALYDFSSGQGNRVEDRSGVGEPLHLQIDKPDAVKRSSGALETTGDTIIRSPNPALKIFNAVRRSGEITVEAWIKPSSTDQSGPARIVTISKSSNERNFTMGQDSNKIDCRFRSTETSTNGIPSIATDGGTLSTELTHLVYARDRSGVTKIYIDGELAVQRTVGGTTLNWESDMRLAFGNELNGSRPWLGTYELVAIYSCDLRPHEVMQNHLAGPNGKTPPASAEVNRSPSAELFHEQVAAILSERCFECHDTTSSDGGLDLSRRAAAEEGGDSGPVIVAGQPADSLLWDLVEADDMPLEREPLSDSEKELLKQWIAAGADWSADEIDPELYRRDRKVDENWVRRLTIREYIATVKVVTGVDIESDAIRLLPADLRADGFSNTAYNLGIDLKHIGSYAELAEIIVGRMEPATFAKDFTDCETLDEDCMQSLIKSMGKWVLRGPVSDSEVAAFLSITRAVEEQQGDFEEAVSFVLEAMLQSPRFIYRIENQRGDGTTWPIDDYELASRMSYTIWGAPPDRELIRAVDAGELLDPNQAIAQVERMLQDPRARAQSILFVSEWLDLGRLDNLRPNEDHYPEWDSELADDMRAESISFFEDLVWEQRRPLAELMNAQFTYVNARLAKHYRMPFEASVEDASQMVRVDVSDIPSRGGLLTHGSVLTVGGDEASMVSRGLFVLQDILRGSIKDPPPCVNTVPPETKAGLTQRGVAESRIANPSCGGCHLKFEPFAFGLEKYDGLGSHFQVDRHGNELRENGELLFPGTSEPILYESTGQLLDVLAKHERVSETITWKLAQFALGRPLIAEDIESLRNIHSTALENGGTYQAVIKAIVLSDLARTIRTEVEE